MRRLCITAFVVLLASCANSPTADTSRTAVSTSLTPSAQTAISTPSIMSAQATESPTTLTASSVGTTVPTPIPQPMPLGQVVQVLGQPGERYSVVIHELRRVTSNPSLGFTEPWVFVDWSVRNDSDKDIRWMTDSGSPALVGADGSRLNEELQFEGIPFLNAADFGEDATCVQRQTSVFPGRLSFLDRAGGIALPPGMVYRTYAAFKQTPGTEAPDIQFEVAFPTSRVLGAEPNRVRFSLSGTPASTPLPTMGPNAAPAAEGSVSGLRYSSAKAEQVTAGQPTIAGQSDPCGWSRVLQFKVTNETGKSISLAAGNLRLVDVDGRMYFPLDNPFVDVSPRGEADVTLTFPALSEDRGRPASLFVPGNQPGEWVLIQVGQ